MFLYLDLIWLLNFGIDYLLLWMTALFRKTPFKKWRLAAAAAIGSGYVLFLFLPPLQPYYTSVVKLVLACVIVWTAFGYGTILRYAALLFTFYFVSFVTGGGLLAVHYFLRSQHELVQGMVATQGSGYGDIVSWWFVIIGFPLMFWFTHSRWNDLRQRKSKEHLLVGVNIHVGEAHVSCQGLVDTGNLLTDPLTKTPVMLVEASVLKKVLPKDVLEIFLDEQNIQRLDELNLPEEWLSNLRIIPYRGIRQQMELLVAFKPDCVEIWKQRTGQGNDGMKPHWAVDRVLIGMNKQAFGDGSFQAIVHPELLQEEYQIDLHSNKEAM